MIVITSAHVHEHFVYICKKNFRDELIHGLNGNLNYRDDNNNQQCLCNNKIHNFTCELHPLIVSVYAHKQNASD